HGCKLLVWDSFPGLSVMVCVTAIRVIDRHWSLFFAEAQGLRLKIGDQVRRILLAEAQDRHAHHGIFLGKRHGGRIAQGTEFRGILDERRKPGALAPCRDIAQVRPNAIANTDRMTRGTYLLEEGLA